MSRLPRRSILWSQQSTGPIGRSLTAFLGRPAAPSEADPYIGHRGAAAGTLPLTRPCRRAPPSSAAYLAIGGTAPERTPDRSSVQNCCTGSDAETQWPRRLVAEFRNPARRRRLCSLARLRPSVHFPLIFSADSNHPRYNCSERAAESTG